MTFVVTNIGSQDIQKIIAGFSSEDFWETTEISDIHNNNLFPEKNAVRDFGWI